MLKYNVKNYIVNQVEISAIDNDANINERSFISYGSMIVNIDFVRGIITLGRDWNRSTTTSKWRNYFFDETMAFNCLDTTEALRKALKKGIVETYSRTFKIVEEF